MVKILVIATSSTTGATKGPMHGRTCTVYDDDVNALIFYTGSGIAINKHVDKNTAYLCLFIDTFILPTE